MLIVREKIISNKETELKRTEELLKQRQALINVYEKNQKDAHQEGLNRQNKLL